jgi:hypothetical protein
MWRLYHSSAITGDYVSLCAQTAHRGEHWLLEKVHRVDPHWRGTGHVRTDARSLERPYPLECTQCTVHTVHQRHHGWYATAWCTLCKTNTQHE